MTAAVSFACDEHRLLTINRATALIMFVGWSGILGLSEVEMSRFASIKRLKLLSTAMRDLCSK